MRHLLPILAKTISILLYPIWMPTLGILFLCIGLRGTLDMQLGLWLVSILGTAIITVAIPLSAILICIKRGKTKDLYIEQREERTLPYIYTLVCYAFWCYFLIRILRVPVFAGISAIGATVALLVVLIVNRWWKISAHLTGLGGLIGGVASYFLFFQAQYIVVLTVLLLVALLLMYARIYLNAHTPLQTVCGLLLGLVLTLLPNIVYFYAL